jgi:hypothetical protein
MARPHVQSLTETAVTRLDGDQPIEARVRAFHSPAAGAKGGQVSQAESRPAPEPWKW